MLPEVKKNIFHLKSKEDTSKFSMKKFLASVLFTGLVGGTTQAMAVPSDLNEIISMQKKNSFMLSHSKRVGETSYHYSHSSHSSHNSHSSHRSHRSSSY